MDTIHDTRGNSKISSSEPNLYSCSFENNGVNSSPSLSSNHQSPTNARIDQKQSNGEHSGIKSSSTSSPPGVMRNEPANANEPSELYTSASLNPFIQATSINTKGSETANLEKIKDLGEKTPNKTILPSYQELTSSPITDDGPTSNGNKKTGDPSPSSLGNQGQ